MESNDARGPGQSRSGGGGGQVCGVRWFVPVSGGCWALPSAGQQKRIKWFKAESTASLHAKAMVIDDDAAFVGSVNLDGRSLIQNTEIGLLIESPTVNAQLGALFDGWIGPDYA